MALIDYAQGVVWHEPTEARLIIRDADGEVTYDGEVTIGRFEGSIDGLPVVNVPRGEA